MRQHWWLAHDHVYLNHGTVGATPKPVLAAQQQLQRDIEAHPARFLIRELADLRPAEVRAAAAAAEDADPPQPRLRAAADRIAAFVGGRGDDLAFIDNASSGVSAVLRSLALAPGDEIVLHDLAYGAVALAARHVARTAGARVVSVSWPFPVRGDDGRLPAWTGPLERAITPRTRLVILDHVVSETALVLPVAALAACARARGVPVLVDGAHAPGAIPLDIPALEVDWYVGNLHKWACAPRASGVLWAAPARQPGLHPPILSWGYDQGFTAEFDWTGTRDPSAWLASPAGIDFMCGTLGLDAMRAWNHALVRQAASRLATRWDSRHADGDPWQPPPDAMTGCMEVLPLPAAAAARFGATPDGAARLKTRLFADHRIEAQVLCVRGMLVVRLSAQVYNEMSDYDRLGDAVLAACAR